MTDERPDPDALLARLRQEEAAAGRGKLKIFFGASAGVGKTFAMLSAARAAQAQGADVVIGIVETHGRVETQALVGGLERLPLRDVAYRERTLSEFDLDAALARRPALVLVDELAHSNVAGSRHPKRWQDVEELLDAGIDVWSTINVQHLETLNDVVNGITGVRVRETVPDRVFDGADEVVIVDLPPDDLLQRLKEGKVYLPQQAAAAVRNFFRKGNLIALRELALRRTADRVDDDILHWRRTSESTQVWQTREGLLLCIGPGVHAERLVRSASRLASQLGVPWHVVFVETPRMQRLAEADRAHALKALKLAQEAGGSARLVSGSQLPAAIVKYAREHNLSRVVLGRDTGRRHPFWNRSLVVEVGRLGGDLDIIQIALPPRDKGVASAPDARATSVAAAPPWWPPYAKTAATCVVAALLAAPVRAVFELSNVVMVFLLAVVVVAVRWGRGPAVLAAFLGVAAFDFLYVPPRLSFSVSDVQYLITFGVMLVVGLVIGQLTAVLKWQASVATARERRVTALYELSRDLSGALMIDQVADIAVRFADSEFGARAALLVADMQDRLQAPSSVSGAPARLDLAIAQWAFDHLEAAGQGTNTLPSSSVLYVPLKAPMRVRGVLAIETRAEGEVARAEGAGARTARGSAGARGLATPESRQLLDTCASLLALSLERLHYIEVAQSTTLQMESERLRNSLLAAISHDLRTPLAALVGMADSMAMAGDAPASRRAELARNIREAATRMNSQVNNLLDMARLQSGQVRLSRQWLPLEEAVGSAVRAMGGGLEGRLRVNLGPDLPLMHVDPGLFERVLCNLLENAVKYTPPGSLIEIGASADGARMRITVDDHGPGLPRHREEAIFDMFERGRKESAQPGVGLGLAICRAIVGAHAGTIVGATRPGGGARFTIELPVEPAPALDGIEEDSGALS